VSTQQGLIEQLEDAIAQKDIRSRAETLRRVTDLFLSGASNFSVEQVTLFDEVMGRLIKEIDVTARAALGNRLVAVSGAPPGVMRGLALDDAVEVAGPVLSRSAALDDATLVVGAKTKSQRHLLAISRREILAECVTDVLVERGDRDVAVSTAGNAGAQFSDFGYSTLVRRAQDDGDLAQVVWVRPEIPRQHLLQLFAQASDAVRQQLESANRANCTLLEDVIVQASNRIQTDIREGSAVYTVARAHVLSLQQSGLLDEALLADFASVGKFDEATIALSLMADLPIGVIERAITNRRTEQILVLCKANGFVWETAKAILLLQAGTKGSSTSELDQCCETFARLQHDTAKKAIQFYRLRERAASPN
jgi:uncharacterized protein (DUF2336 family)